MSNPGPGTYAPPPDKGSRYKNSPNVRIGTARRADLANTSQIKNPAPGSYEPVSRVGEGPKYHMAGRVKTGGIFRTNEAPGPGAYKPDAQVGMVRSASYTLKSRSKLGTQIVINPESNTHEKMTPGNSFNVPGPGSYSSQYNQLETSLSSSFCKEKRAGLSVKGADKQPAANAYDQEAKNKVLKSSPSFGFGTSKRPATASADSRRVPGPGQYTQKTIFGSESPGFTLGKKL